MSPARLIAFRATYLQISSKGGRVSSVLPPMDYMHAVSILPEGHRISINPDLLWNQGVL